LKRLNTLDDLVKFPTSDISKVRKDLIDDLQEQIWLIVDRAKKLFSLRDKESIDERGKIKNQVFFVKLWQ